MFRGMHFSCLRRDSGDDMDGSTNANEMPGEADYSHALTTSPPDERI